MFDECKYWDVFAEYAKNDDNDILCKITVANRGPEEATIHVLPTLWYRNTWIWGCKHEGCTVKPRIARSGPNSVSCTHQTLDKFHCYWDVDQRGKVPELWFTENETNSKVFFIFVFSRKATITLLAFSIQFNMALIYIHRSVLGRKPFTYDK